ncbi:LysM peptidoglycan-binding domain-containing protein [Methylacidiphilum caldifontis]|nr:LysM peptidoglycan-binding domain-containing protein [Methylacidiphilum caldifontis]
MALIIILFFSLSFFLSPSYALERGSSPSKPADTTSKKPTEIKYVVKRGDSLWKISRKYKVTVEALMAINELKDDRLKPGQELIIPPKGYRPPPKELLPLPSQEEKKDTSKTPEPPPLQNP